MKVKIILSIIAISLMFGAFGQVNSVIDSLGLVLKTAKEDSVKVNRLNSLSKEYIEIRDLENALQYADSALVLADKIKYMRGKANAYLNIGAAYCEQGNYPEALKNYNIALKVCEDIGAKKDIAYAYGNLGFTYYKQGEYSESMGKYITSLNIYEEIGDKKGIGNANNWIGNITKEQNNYDDAMKYYMVALKMREEVGDKHGMACTIENIGGIYHKYNNYSEALKNYFLALSIYEEIGDKNDICHIYSSIGQIYLSQKDYSEAQKNLHIALKISEEIGAHLIIAWVKISLGHLYISLDNNQDARRHLEEALTLSEQYGNKENLQWVHFALARLNRVEGNIEEASEHRKMFTIYRDSLVNESTYRKIALLKIQYETEKKDREIDLLNKDNEIKTLQLEEQRLIRNGMIACAMFLMLIGLLIFRSFRLRKKLEKQTAVTEERKRISADLHDDVGSGLSKIMLLSELVKKVAQTPETKKEAERISEISKELSSNISEIIWALNSNNDYAENMVAYIRRYAAEYFEHSHVKLKIKTPGKIALIPISGEHRRNIFYTVKEAMHNIIKHAQASEAELKFKVKSGVLSVIIKDNGKGIPEGELNRFGNGISNMKNRMKAIKGDFIIENHNGTKITLTLPV